MDAEHRHSRRRNVWLKGAVWCGSRGVPCTVVDASLSGCRISCDHPENLDDDVIVHVPGLLDFMPGQVVWRSGRQAGIHFTRAFKPETVAEQQPGAL